MSTKASKYLGTELGDMAVNERVIGGFIGARVDVIAVTHRNEERDRQYTEHDQQRAPRALRLGGNTNLSNFGFSSLLVLVQPDLLFIGSV